MSEEFLRTLSSVIANATPLVIAALGETLTERAGVINLSLDGSIVLASVAAFVVALATGNAALGVLAAMIVGLLVALLIAFTNIKLRQDQVAVGFVLTLLCTDLAIFLSQGYTRIPGPQITRLDIPLLADLPIIGTVFFRQNLFVYFSYVLVIAAWFWLFRTRGGLAHRAVGERPEAAYARGTRVNAQRYLFTAIGGALVGVAGASYALTFKPGLAVPPSMAGDGWIALAIVIFGGWHPFRVLLGAYLFAALRAISADIQRSGLVIFDQPIPINFVLLNALPWILMILTLLLVSSGGIDRLLRALPRPVQNRLRSFLRSDPPAALGQRFDPD